MIEIRNLTPEDIEPINDIYEKQSKYGIPSLNNMIGNTVFTKDGKVIGYGTVKLFAEGFLILDSDLGMKDRAEAVKEALQTMVLFSRDAGLEQLYVIPSSESYSKILQNKYGFKAVPGELLMLNLNPSEALNG
jgi:hypothetical protein